jgi:hypothetical protein
MKLDDNLLLLYVKWSGEDYLNNSCLNYNAEAYIYGRQHPSYYSTMRDYHAMTIQELDF